jgi:Ca2+-binding RTX toxin-like protein
LALIAGGAVGLVLMVAAALAAPTPVGSDFRISNAGSEMDASSDARSPAVAYNPAANNYLVVWEQDGHDDPDEFEIFGQLVSATGTEVGTDFRISNTTLSNGPNRDSTAAAVAYNSTANEYLVVWQADGLVATNDEFEIFGQRVSAAGVPDAQGDFRISNVGTDTDADRGGFDPAVGYNSAANEYLVSWDGDGLATDDEFEIFGQRVSAAGVPDVQGDFRISNVGNDGDAARDAFDPAVAHNTAANEYLVAWEGDDHVIGPLSDDEFEIFGQRVSAAGVPDVQGDFRISNVSDVDSGRDAGNTALAYNSTANQYLVAWHGDGLATDQVFEIFGQRVTGAGAEEGSDFRISNLGTDTDADRGAFFPTLAYSSAANEYMVGWEDDALVADDEYEILGQRVNAAGAELGTDFRISHTTDVAAGREAFNAALAHNSVANEYLVTWQGDGLATDDELEIFGHRLAEPAVPPIPSPATPTPAAAPKCKGKTATVSTSGLARTLTGTSKKDVIVGTSKKDKINARGGNDLVCAKGGKDTVKGKGGKDKLYGQSGKDTLKGGGGKDKLVGGGGADKLIGGAGTDVLAGGGGKDTQVQ